MATAGTTRIGKRLALLLVAALCATVGISPAHASDWAPDHPALTPVNGMTAAKTPQIRMSASGDAVAVTTVTDGTYLYLQAATRPAGGAWTTPEEIVSPTSSSTGIHSTYALAVDALGDALVVWSQASTRANRCIPQPCIPPPPSPTWRLMYSYRSAGGTWSTPATLAGVNAVQSTFDVLSPRASFDGAGNAIVVWSQYSSSTSAWSVNYADRTPGDAGTWSAATALAADTSEVDPRPAIATDDGGDAAAAWTYRTGGTSYGARASVRPAGGVWDGSHDIGASTGAVSSDANVRVVNTGSQPYPAAGWIQGGYVNGGYRNGNGSWALYPVTDSTNTTLPDHGGHATALQTTMTSWGNSVFVWRELGSATTGNDAYIAGASGYVFSMAAKTGALSYYGDYFGNGTDFSASAPAITMTSDDRATVAWSLLDKASDPSASAISLQSSSMPDTTTFEFPVSAQDVTAPSTQAVPPALAGGGLDIEALWTQGPTVSTSLLDRTPPTQTGLTVPSGGSAGTGVPMSVSSSDVWSSASTTWDFGDGSTASGDAVSHTYDVAGNFAVRAITVDEAGNQTVSEAQLVTVEPSPSSGGSAWITPTSFLSSGPGGATVAVNGRGDAAAVWYSAPDSCSGADAYFHPAGGNWAYQSLGSGCNPFIAIRDDGEAIAIWEDPSCPEGNCIYAAEQPKGGTWGTAVKVATATGVPNNSPVVRFAPDGTATGAWWAYDSGSSTFHLDTADWSAGTWSAPSSIPGSADANQGTRPELAFDGQSNGAIVWESASAGGTFGIKGSTRVAGSGSWADASANNTATGPGPLLPLAASTISIPHLAVDSNGTFLAVWSDSGSMSTAETTAAKADWTVAAFGPASSSDPVIAFDSSDRAIAAWAVSPSRTPYIQTAVRSGATWSAPETLSTTKGRASGQAIVADGKGNVVVGWVNFSQSASGKSYLVQMARRSAGALTSGAAQTLASSDNVISGPFLGADAPGNITAMWFRGDYVETTAFDPVPPTATFDPLPDPVAGTPATFSATASDTWSGVTYSWVFDGEPPVTGNPVTHTFPHASPHTIDLTVRDAAGNTTTLSRTIEVSNPAAAPPPSASQSPTNPAPTPTDPAPLPPGADQLAPPVLGESINVFVLKDPVSVREPGVAKFHRLIKQAHLPNGTVIDTRTGQVLVAIANGAGGIDAAKFYEGLFEVNQPKRLKGLANIFLNGGGFKGCPKAPKDPHAQLSKKKPSVTRSVRHLWGEGTGKFRTVGRFSSATVRGTKWLTDDKCNGTLTRVTAGKVAVRDFVKQKNVVVTKGKSYLARPKLG